MKLLLMWLFGVPITVAFMVMAQARQESQRLVKRVALRDSLRVEAHETLKRSTKPQQLNN